MSPPTSIPPSRSTQVDKQAPRPRLEHDSDDGKAAPLPSNNTTSLLPPVIKLEGKKRTVAIQWILKEQELEMQEKVKIQEAEKSNGWKFTSEAAGKMYLKLQENNISTFIDCHNFARDCKKAIRSDPRADPRVDIRRKGASAPRLSILLTPEKKAQHLRRLDTLLTSKNKYAQYWTVEDLPSEWLKIDNEALFSKEEQALLIKETEKKKKALEKSKPGGKVEDGKCKEGHRLPINAVKKPNDDRQIEGRQGPIYKLEVEGVVVTKMRRSSREKLDGRAHEGRQVLEDELKKERTTSKNGPRIHDTKVEGKIKDIQQAPINDDGREHIVVENPKGNTRTETDQRFKEGHQVPGDEVVKTRTAVAEKFKHNGRKEINERSKNDTKSKGGCQMLGDDIAKKDLVPGDRPRVGNPEVDGKLKNTYRAPINGTEKEQVLIEKPRAGSKVEDDGNFNEDNVLPKKRHGSATMGEAENKRAMPVDKSRNIKLENDGKPIDNSLPPKKKHGSQ
ncbi:hypothetical protein EAE96_001149 [Botrytis aclada]|nr:hypothetical protein EAE96_001149 [Botrytis aclada]